jgi:hypothetical protein
MRKHLKGRVENGLLFLIASVLAISLKVVYETTHSPHLLSGTNVLQRHLDRFSHFSKINTTTTTTTVAMRLQVQPQVVVTQLYPDSVDPFYTIPSDGTNLWDHPSDSQRLPDWMKAYFNWHKHQRQTNMRMLVLSDDDGVTGWKHQRWLVMRVSLDRILGDAAGRSIDWYVYIRPNNVV